MSADDVLSAELSEKTFKCCVKKAVKITVCIKCGAVYHKSCLERRNYQTIDEVRIICCQEKEINQDKNSSIVYQEEVTQRYEQEIHYLKQIIIEKNEKYNILVKNNQLLDEKVKYLDTNNKQETEANKKLPIVKINTQAKNVENNSQIKTNLHIPSNKADNDLNKNKNVQFSNRTVENKIQANKNILHQHIDNASTTTYTGTLEKVQKQVMQDVINLANDYEAEKNEWHVVQNRGRRTIKRNIGEFKESTGKFKGLKPKVWMYIYRVNGDVEESDIEKYLKERTHHEEEFLVKYLGSTKNNLKCFKVAGDFKFKEDFYSPTFWPHGVGYRRFDFRKDEFQFQKKENSEQQPSSFLDLTTA